MAPATPTVRPAREVRAAHRYSNFLSGLFCGEPERAYPDPVLYHFEFHGEHAWEAFGSGEGSGPEAVALALADLRRLAGGELPAGEYRCIAAGGASARWQSLWLGEGGRIMVDRDSPVVAV